MVSLYGLFADVSTMSRHLTLLTGILPSGVLDLLAQEMSRIASKSTPTLSTAFLVSFAIAFWSANSGVVALFDALNVIYKRSERNEPSFVSTAQPGACSQSFWRLPRVEHAGRIGASEPGGGR